MQCAIWGTPAKEEPTQGDYAIVDSPRAGGKYWISGNAASAIGSLNDHEKRLLTTWLCEQRYGGIDVPEVDTAVLDLVKARQPYSFSKRFTTVLRGVGDRINQLGEELVLRDGDPEVERFLAQTDSVSGRELAELIRLLKQTGLVEATFYSSGVSLRPTARGWEEIDNLKRHRTDSSQAFVAMWFNNDTKSYRRIWLTA
jgi:hypothetical protein